MHLSSQSHHSKGPGGKHRSQKEAASTKELPITEATVDIADEVDLSTDLLLKAFSPVAIFVWYKSGSSNGNAIIDSLIRSHASSTNGMLPFTVASTNPDAVTLQGKATVSGSLLQGGKESMIEIECLTRKISLEKISPLSFGALTDLPTGTDSQLKSHSVGLNDDVFATPQTRSDVPRLGIDLSSYPAALLVTCRSRTHPQFSDAYSNAWWDYIVFAGATEIIKGIRGSFETLMVQAHNAVWKAQEERLALQEEMEKALELQRRATLLLKQLGMRADLYDTHTEHVYATRHVKATDNDDDGDVLSEISELPSGFYTEEADELDDSEL